MVAESLAQGRHFLQGEKRGLKNARQMERVSLCATCQMPSGLAQGLGLDICPATAGTESTSPPPLDHVFAPGTRLLSRDACARAYA